MPRPGNQATNCLNFRTAANNSDRRSRQAHQPVKEIYRRLVPLFLIVNHMTKGEVHFLFL
jgi:hypothetical protein